jgi:uncharacterized protein (TIGR03086 family)
MPADHVAAPTDQIESAEATLAILQKVLHGIDKDDLSKQTPCREFDVAKLTDHLMNSITMIGAAAGAEIPPRDTSAPVETQISVAAEAALDAWRKRGVDGTVPFGSGEAPAAMMAGVLSIEFLVHAWDYAMATGQHLPVPVPVSDYVLTLAHDIITPQGRKRAGFDAPIDLPDDARVFDKLLAFTGRNPGHLDHGAAQHPHTRDDL